MKVYRIVYVDDFVVGSVSEEELTCVRKQLGQHFEIVNLGDVKHFLGLEVQKGTVLAWLTISTSWLPE